MSHRKSSPAGRYGQLVSLAPGYKHVRLHRAAPRARRRPSAQSHRTRRRTR
jgi:hypothetical protein